MNPKYPIYIVSKGRWKNCLTSKILHMMDVPHYLIVEPDERHYYKAMVDSSATVIALDSTYRDNYDTCDDLGDTKAKGSGPARNFAWDDSINKGFSWHWLMDDNIRKFYRLICNMKIPLADGTGFRCMEDFVERYENIAMAGPQYQYFITRKAAYRSPFKPNTRIYSCNLIRNDTPYRWRGRYNEDTDLSIRMLKDRWCTVLFYAFLQDKTTTQTMKGGNTDQFYSKEGTFPKSLMQVNLHPDISKITWRYGRWHHEIDYSRFTWPLRRRSDISIPTGIDDYGMIYQKKVDNKWVKGRVDD